MRIDGFEVPDSVLKPKRVGFWARVKDFFKEMFG